tara:strand:+ start:83 stop:388 length:306 start_codon:yes stop_codon:yes gene_type:complete
MILGMKNAGKSVGIAVLLLSVHFITIQIYATWCVPYTFIGAITSIFTVSSPPCTFLLSIASRSQELYTAAWVAMGMAIISVIGGMWVDKPTIPPKNNNINN